jgi:pimeloyl-ACP methyl ester carboxylesterase
MEAPRTSAFTGGRIVALVVIALLVSGLIDMRLDSERSTVSLPEGAQAGDLVLEPCRYDTEDGSYDADCGTLVVPENRHDPDSRLIALPVTRIRARSSDPGPPMFYFEGGPGTTNMDFPEVSRFADDRDVVLVGYRGLDGSVRLDCPEIAASRARSRDWLSTASLESDAAAMRACAARLSEEGVDLAGYTLPQRIDDIDAARRSLGYEAIDVVGESFGTRVALIYAWRYPEHVHRSVLVGANPPGNFLWDPETIERQLRRYAALCAADQACSGRTDDLVASVHAAFERMPDRWGILPINTGALKAALVVGLVNATSEGGGPFAAPLTIDMLLSTQEGDASGAWLYSVFVSALVPHVYVHGDQAAMALSDAAYARRYFASPVDRGSQFGGAGMEFAWGGGRLLDAWPVTADHALYDRVPDSDVETLVVGGELDFSTPPENATRELLPHLSDGQEVVLPNLGHTEDFWAYQPQASTRLIKAYLDAGSVDTSLYTERRVRFTPWPTYGTLAKIVLAAMLGLAALTVVSLAWMALRVRRRGALGPTVRVVVRSIYALVIGMGGLFLGMLIVLAALPTVPLVSGWLHAVSIGVAVGLVIYLAWVNRFWSATTKTVGFISAAGGALLGAWLGAHATGIPPLAPPTAILGAVLGSNLAVIVLDIVLDSRRRPVEIAAEPEERPVAQTTAPAPTATTAGRPS